MSITTDKSSGKNATASVPVKISVTKVKSAFCPGKKLLIEIDHRPASR